MKLGVQRDATLFCWKRQDRQRLCYELDGWGSNLGGGEIFRVAQNGPVTQPDRVFRADKAAEASC
jgi:hypothetical protein